VEVEKAEKGSTVERRTGRGDAFLFDTLIGACLGELPEVPESLI